MYVQPGVPEHVVRANILAGKILDTVRAKARFLPSINQTMMLHTRISHTIVSMLHELKGVKR